MNSLPVGKNQGKHFSHKGKAAEIGAVVGELVFSTVDFQNTVVYLDPDQRGKILIQVSRFFNCAEFSLCAAVKRKVPPERGSK